MGALQDAHSATKREADRQDSERTRLRETLSALQHLAAVEATMRVKERVLKALELTVVEVVSAWGQRLWFRLMAENERLSPQNAALLSDAESRKRRAWAPNAGSGGGGGGDSGGGPRLASRRQLWCGGGDVSFFTFFFSYS